MSRVPREYLRVEDVDDVTVVRFEGVQMDSIRSIGDRLHALIEAREGVKLLLDFSGVRFVTSNMLGKLVHLKKKAVATHGQVKLCCLAPYLRTVFEVSRLDRLLEIYGDEQAALDAFQGVLPSATSPQGDLRADTVDAE
jgi:anti-sigma B factor antagonist